MLRPGTQAPDFVAHGHDGSTWRLDDLRGRYVVIWFFPRAATPG